MRNEFRVYQLVMRTLWQGNHLSEALQKWGSSYAFRVDLYITSYSFQIYNGSKDD